MKLHESRSTSDGDAESEESELNSCEVLLSKKAKVWNHYLLAALVIRPLH